MKLKKLQLENFRNYPDYFYQFDPDKDLTILVGPNAKGKTNFLESIYVLSLGKSFRASHHDDMVAWQKDHLRCRAEVFLDGEDISLEVFYSSLPIKKKNFKRNGVKMANSKYLGNLLTVLFHPEDLNMLYLDPSLRRKYLDIVLCQTDKNYLYALMKYRRVLRQRNALLHTLRESQFKKLDTGTLDEDLQAWDEELAQFGSIIVQERIKLVDFISGNLPKFYHQLSDQDEQVSVLYKSALVGKTPDSPDLNPSSSLQEKEDTPSCPQDFLAKYLFQLESKRKLDILRAQTTIGPHRDDLVFHINGKEIATSASRGEYRTLLLALKLAEIEFIKQKTGTTPILLLDDVFSELDSRRQNHLLKAIHGCQAIITTTDVESIEKSAGERAFIEIV